MRCMRCGAELRPDAKFCGVCGQVLGSGGASGGGYQKTAPQAPVSGGYSAGGYQQPSAGYMPGYSNTGSYPVPSPTRKEVNRMPDGVALGSDERIVRQYQIGRFTLRQGAIEVIVTNKRVIRFEQSSLFGMRNARIAEINIDSVHGVNTEMCRSFNPIALTISAILIIVGLIMTIVTLTQRESPLIPLGALALGVIILLFTLKPRLEFKLLASIGNEALDTRVNDKGRIFRGGSGTNAVFQFKPTEETTVMLMEIGALIYDLKTLGDAAISRWV